jgi:hypothetical protein
MSERELSSPATFAHALEHLDCENKKRVIVWDNGGDYSDHRILFLEAPEGEDLKKIERALKLNNCDSHIKMVANDVDWWYGGTAKIVDEDGDGCRSLLEIEHLFAWSNEDKDIFKREEAEFLGREFIKNTSRLKTLNLILVKK